LRERVSMPHFFMPGIHASACAGPPDPTSTWRPFPSGRIDVADFNEPWHGLRRQIVTGGLRCPDLNQRHQALFSRVALCVSGVSCLRKTAFRP